MKTKSYNMSHSVEVFKQHLAVQTVKTKENFNNNLLKHLDN